jgi:hypothetical protein
MSTLDVLSAGRAMLGIGAAWNEWEWKGLGIPFPPLAEVRAAEETPQIAQRIFAGTGFRMTACPATSSVRCTPPAPLRPAAHDDRRLRGEEGAATGGGVRRFLQLCSRRRNCPQARGAQGHCVREARDDGEITKTAICSLDPRTSTDEVVEPVSDLAALGVEVVIVNTSNLWEAGRVKQLGELVAAVVDL